MDPILIGIGSLFVLFLFLVIGIHVALALILSSLCGLVLILGFSPSLNLIASTFVVYGSNYTLSVVPLFICMGLLANATGSSSQAYDALVAWTGKARGALGLATIGGCTLFGAITGSSIATASLFARISAPEMIKHGYDRKYTYGLIASAGAIGMLIPPSILAIVYAAMVELPAGKVLLAGVGPGLLLSVGLGITVYGMAVVRPSLMPIVDTKVSWNHKFRLLRYLWAPFLIGTIVIGGIYSGIFTATEGAAIGNFVLLIIYFVKSGFSMNTLKGLSAVLVETVRLTAIMFILFCAAQLFARLIVLCGLSELMIGLVVDSAPSPVALALGTVVLLVILGCFIDSLSMLVVTVPLLIPVLQSIGGDPIWFGMVMILASQIGLITPPIGLNLYIVKGIAGSQVTINEIIQGVIPFLIATLVVLGLVILMPSISLTLILADMN